MSDFGETLTRLRGSRVSLESLALRADMTTAFVAGVEDGTVKPTQQEAQRLLLALGYRLREQRVEPLPARSDLAGRPAQLVMTAEERMESAAAMGNLAAELQENDERPKSAG